MVSARDPSQALETALDHWLSATRDDLKALASHPWAVDFTKRYLRVVSEAERTAPALVARLVEMGHAKASADRAPVDTLLDYVDAMSVEVDGEPIFLPSFSDTCLQDSLQAPGLYLSPFRGLYYCWQLGELAILLGQALHATPNRFLHLRHPYSRASKRLAKVWSELEEDFRKQRSDQYSRYYRQITGPHQEDPTLSLVLAGQIQAVKDALTFGIQRKGLFTRFLPYQCQHSTHFYLSGIRFYWSPILQSPEGFDSVRNRYSVQSASSGLTIPSERYGMLLPDDPDQGAEEELLELLPPGSLRLHLDQRPPEDDLGALAYFERWSRLVTAKAYSLIADIEEVLSCAHEAHHAGKRPTPEWTRLAQAVYLSAVAKNPMRTFYFDTGLLAAAEAAGSAPERHPAVQYVTTRHSTPTSQTGQRLLKEVLDRCGDGLELFCRRRGNLPPILDEFTLVPLGPELNAAGTFLWSIRDEDARKISAGLEGRASALAQHRAQAAVRSHAKVEMLIGGAASAAATGAALALGSPVALPVEGIVALATGSLVYSSEYRRARAAARRVSGHLLGVGGSAEYLPVRHLRDFG